jgi:hypothetical protein
MEDESQHVCSVVIAFDSLLVVWIFLAEARDEVRGVGGGFFFDDSDFLTSGNFDEGVVRPVGNRRLEGLTGVEAALGTGPTEVIEVAVRSRRHSFDAEEQEVFVRGTSVVVAAKSSEVEQRAVSEGAFVSRLFFKTLVASQCTSSDTAASVAAKAAAAEWVACELSSSRRSAASLEQQQPSASR